MGYCIGIGERHGSACRVTARIYSVCLQCFDTVGWAAGRASGL